MSDVYYVSYCRVSTEKQGRSGLGLDAQKFAVAEFLKGSQGKMLAEYVEIETGRRRDRPELAAALDLCARRRATLVVAKLDRLARNVAFISSLLESRARFVALDMPEADPAFLQMAAVFGEWEAKRTSERTSAALQAAKARGVRLGWSNPMRKAEHQEASQMARRSIRQKAELFALNTRPIIESIQRSGVVSFEGIAKALNARGVHTRRGGLWHPSTVRNVLRYADC